MKTAFVRMIRHPMASCAIVALVTLAALADDENKPHGLNNRKPWTSSRIIGTPEPPPPYTVRRVFPNLKFTAPLCIAQEPGSNRLMVGEHAGKIYAFDMTNPVTDSKELFLDIGREMYAFSFHPDYEENGEVFVFSPRDPKDKSEQQLSRVSRFVAGKDMPRKCAPETESVIIEWTAGGHNGGEAIIGPDGYLYISTGDSTSGSDLKATGQGVDDLLSVIMRIDVDHGDPGKAYLIPQDNPFANTPGARPEIWAFGFRNPWRMSFDPQTGELWVGDVGQDLWEMIWLVQRGGNYGWSVQEGTHPFHPNKPSGPGPILPPVIEHHHTECRSITGGYVYRGSKFPELDGVYFYGDYEYGKIWGLRHGGGEVTWHKELADTSLRIPTFGVSRDGEILLMDHGSGELYALTRAPVANTNNRFPRRLSETGLFESVASHTVAPGVVPYSVNVPQWADNATKHRFLGLQGDSKISFVERSGDARSWGFDDGTVTMETISIALKAGDPNSKRRIETRIMVKQENHWLGYSYAWNDDQTDAELVASRGKDIVLSIEDEASPGGARQQTWRIPSRNECMVCHSRAAAFVLGLRTDQMNRNHDYGGVVDNQLRTFDKAGLFGKPIEKNPDEYDSLVNPYDDSGEFAGRARSYLHVNCSVCHVSDGGGNAKLKLKFHEDLANTNLINETPLHGTFGLENGKVIVPGDPYASVLFYRISKTGRGRMPHVGSKLTDDRGLELIHDWIKSMDSAEQVQLSVAEETRLVKQLAASAPANELDSRLAQVFSSVRRSTILARLIAAGFGSATHRAQIVELAMAQEDPNVRDLFERFVPEDQRLKRLGDSFDLADVLSLRGDPVRGKQLFSGTAMQCKNCHGLDEGGATLGPNLRGIGKKYKRSELLESLADPSRKIEDKYMTHVLATSAGKILTGILAEKTDTELTLQVLKEGKGEPVKIPISEVEELLPQKKSLMPDGLLRELTAQQAADLIEYLHSLKVPKPGGS